MCLNSPEGWVQSALQLLHEEHTSHVNCESDYGRDSEWPAEAQVLDHSSSRKAPYQSSNATPRWCNRICERSPTSKPLGYHARAANVLKSTSPTKQYSWSRYSCQIRLLKLEKIKAAASSTAPVRRVGFKPNARLNLVTTGAMNVIWDIERPPTKA